MNKTNSPHYSPKIWNNMSGDHTRNQNGTMSFIELVENIASAHGWKAAMSAVVSFIGFHLLPVAPFLAMGTMLVICDWITGVHAAMIRGEKLTSRGFNRTTRKIVYYGLAIVLVMSVEVTYFKTQYLVYLVSVYISLVELYSNLENISSITGTDVLSIVSKAISAKFKIKK